MKAAAKSERSMTLYEEVADRIGHLIEEGTFRPGQRIPSVRSLSRQMSVSVSTVMQAYGLLEDRGSIEARPQSGYYVLSRCLRRMEEARKGFQEPSVVPSPLSISEICTMLVGDPRNKHRVPLGAATLDPALLPVDKLTRVLGQVNRRYKYQSIAYDSLPGHQGLRTQIAKRAISMGCLLTPDEIVTTQGCLEAVNLSLRAVCRPGDTVITESPTFFGFFQLIGMLGLRALEIPTDPGEGISLDTLRYAIEHHPVRACLIASNFSNPVGSRMADERKKELVELLGFHNIPLIEDDIYGDLYFDAERPRVAKAYDKKGLVLLCSSFSKTLAPGYRVGWVAPGRFQREVERNKILTNIAGSMPTQLAVAEFLANGGYEHHLRRLRKAYKKQTRLMAEAVLRLFPDGTGVTRPSGGHVLWVKFPDYVDSLALYEECLQAGITIAPGPIFSSGDRYRNFVRLNAGYWSDKVEAALRTVGDLAARQAL